MIYKPTDLSPSAQTFDVKDTPIFFECKVDTSNVKAEGYTIKILDSENNVVFSSIPVDSDGNYADTLNIKYITKIDDLNSYLNNENIFDSYLKGYNLLNTGYNGTYLKFPFSVAIDDKSTNTAGINQIFYSEEEPTGATKKAPSGLYKYTSGAINAIANGETLPDADIFEPVEIYNGQEYKWSITLYQLENVGTARTPNWQLPKNPLYYDMPLTTGTVLGSNNIRIQSVLSDEIYQDYFIQPAKVNGLKYDPEHPEVWTYTSVGGVDIDESDSHRVLIKSYDPTYGFIYPTTGEQGFLQETITPDPNNGSNAFRIYKRGNNTDNLTAYQQVVYVCDKPLDSSAAEQTELRNASASWKWNSLLANPGESYGTLTYYSNENPNGLYNVPNISIQLQGNERIILNGQSTQASGSGANYKGSPYNGIFYPQFSVKEVQDWNTSTLYSVNDSVKRNNKIYRCTGEIKGIRPPNASYWTSYGTGSSTESPAYNLYSSTDTYGLNDDNNKVAIYDSTNHRYNYYMNQGNAEINSAPEIAGNVCWKEASGAATFQYCITVNWLRTPDADTWGELKNKIVLVTNSNSQYYGQNLQIKDINDNADAYGTINETPFKFVPELPIEIYKNNYNLYVSGTSYNQGDIVRYTKSSGNGTYQQYMQGTATNYTPGDIIYYTLKFWICIKTPERTTDNPGDTSQYWAEYKAQSYYVAKANNISTPPINSAGVVDSNWSENPYLGNTGLIFYNNALGSEDPISSTDSTNGRLYIRHFDGLSDGMTLFKNTTTNEQYYVKIDKWNPQYNFITYDKLYKFNTYKEYASSTDPNPNPTTLSTDTDWDPADSIGAGTKYQIKTFFRESDENAFYFYTSPQVAIHYESASGVDFVEDMTPTIKYYQDYKDNISSYDDSSSYEKGDVVRYSGGYYEAIKNIAPGSWAASSWDGPRTNTTTYCKYFSYSKDEIVKYNNKNDFLLWSSDISYERGDRVEENNAYYVAKKSVASGSSFNTDSWDQVSSYDKIPDLYYMALTNVPIGIAPSYKNIGIYWEQYIGNLFESEGYVNAPLFSPNKTYKKGDVVTHNGNYYCFTEDYGGGSDFFDFTERSNDNKPFSYNTTLASSYKMGTVVLSRGIQSDNIPASPDYYYVKIKNDVDSSEWPVDSSNWQIYNGPLFDSSGWSSNDIYDTVVSDPNSGAYYIKKNIGVSSLDKGPQAISKILPYDGNKTYAREDKVLYNNLIYVCIIDSPGGYRPTNSTYWALYPWQIYIPEISERTLVVSADYKQQEYVQWKSAQWFLLDARNGDVIEQSPVLYDGELAYTFHGLAGREKDSETDQFFVVRMILETYNGYRMTIDSTIETVFSVEEISSQGLVEVVFDCDNTAVMTTITKETGFIVPTLSSDSGVEYSNNGDGHMNLDGQMQYDKVAASIENASLAADAKPIKSMADSFVLQSEQTITSDNYAGNLIGLGLRSDGAADTDPFDSEVSVYIPEMLITQKGGDVSSDEMLGNKDFLTINLDRNKVLGHYGDKGNNNSFDIRIYTRQGEESNWEQISSSGDLGLDASFKTVSNLQDHRFNSNSSLDVLYGKRTNYLPISYEYDSQDNEYYRAEFKNVDVDNEIFINITSSIDTSSTEDTNKYIKQIMAPTINSSRFVSYSSIDFSSSYDTKFATAAFIQNGNNSSSRDTSSVDIYVTAETSAFWSDYNATVPNRVLIGQDDDKHDHYTQKNVLTDKGWQWADSHDNSADTAYFWSDGDYIDTYEGYNCVFGTLSVNGELVQVDQFINAEQSEILSNNPHYSNTYFEQQRIVTQTTPERAQLNGDVLITNLIADVGDDETFVSASADVYYTNNSGGNT